MLISANGRERRVPTIEKWNQQIEKVNKRKSKTIKKFIDKTLNLNYRQGKRTFTISCPTGDEIPYFITYEDVINTREYIKSLGFICQNDEPSFVTKSLHEAGFFYFTVSVPESREKKEGGIKNAEVAVKSS